MHALDAKTVVIVVLAAVLAAMLLHRLLIIRRDNLCDQVFGFKPNPHDPAGNAERMRQKLDEAFSGLCDANRELQRTELALESAKRIVAQERRRHRRMQQLARSFRVEFVQRSI